MRWTRNELLEETLLDGMLEQLDKDYVKQSPSVSDLIYCLTRTYLDSTIKIPPTRKTKLYFTIGLALERVLVKDKEAATTGCCEGIYYHIDSMDYDNLLEMKSTRISPNKEPNSFSSGWLRQVMAYLYTQGKTNSSFAVLHIGSAPAPELIVWELEFEQAEIDTNWLWLQQRKAVWDMAVATNDAPESYKYNEDWECRECVYATLCEARKASR